jgi:flagellar biosynthesis chaperone FliJ
MCYATKYLNNLKETVTELKKARNELRKKQQEYDLLLSEKYHELETKKFNAAEGYYLAKGLQAILQERRVIKNELSRLDSIYTTLNVDHLVNSINKSNQNLIKIVDKNNTYTQNFDENVYKVVQ